MRKIVYLALLISCFTMLVQAVAQAPVRLSPIWKIRKGVDAWPMILDPKNDAEQRINGHLSELNYKLTHSLKDCGTNYDDGEGGSFLVRHTKVTMLGPVFLSLVAKMDLKCSGGHPYSFTDVVVFNLRTGEPVDPRSWFLPSLQASLSEGSEEYPTQENPPLEKSVLVTGLLKAYQEATDHSCDEAYRPNQSFLVWPDANSGRVMVQASHLGGCCQACGVEVGLTLEQARKFGFSETFLQAITHAHNRPAHR
jgi:hypothetical protein